MFAIDICMARAHTNYSHLPSAIIDSVVNARPFWRDLQQRLRKLPEIKLGKHVATGNPSSPHQNAIRYCETHPAALLYVGYVISRTKTGEPWKIEEHSFCVENNRVYEPTDMAVWNVQDTHYVGFEVPMEDRKNLRYLNLFDRMSYILELSPMAA